jgi:hypothetical protein
MVLWDARDSCEGVVGRFGLPSKEAFKTLNPFFEGDCDARETPGYAGRMVCVKELGPGEESQPLPCQEFHAVMPDERSFDDVIRRYRETMARELDLVKLNPTVKPDGLIPGEILCIARDSSRPLPPPCDVFYPFGLKEEPSDCSALVKQFVSESFPLEELNRLNPDHPCDLARPERLAPGHLFCLREPKEGVLNKGSFLEENHESSSAAAESPTTSPITTTPAATESTTTKA